MQQVAYLLPVVLLELEGLLLLPVAPSPQEGHPALEEPPVSRLLQSLSPQDTTIVVLY